MCEIGKRLKIERKRIGLGQVDLGQCGGVSLNSQSNYELGKRSPDANYLAKVAESGVDINYVITGERGNSGVSEVKPQYLAAAVGSLDQELLKSVVAEVMNAIKWHSSLHNIDPEIIADVIGVLYNNFQKENKKPKNKDPAILSTIELLLTG